jgi:hypothetical protein
VAFGESAYVAGIELSVDGGMTQIDWPRRRFYEKSFRADSWILIRDR